MNKLDPSDAGLAVRFAAPSVATSSYLRPERKRYGWANHTLETNRRRASPFDAGQEFERAVCAPACTSGGGRSALSFGA